MNAAFWLGWLLPTYNSIIRIYQSLFTRSTTAPSRHLSYDDYTVAWICALPVEMAAAQALLDEVHQDLPSKPKDNNAYILGRLGKHNIVVAGLPFGGYNNASATVVATQLISSFQSVRFALVVGIGGGVPSEKMDIRLGDIVVGKPGIKHGGVVSFDSIEASANGYPQRVHMLDQPPQILSTALMRLQSLHLTRNNQVESILGEIKTRIGQNAQKFARPIRADRLFAVDYNHVDASYRTCDSCNARKTVHRRPRNSSAPIIHYGLIASTDRMVHDSIVRDRLSQEFRVDCIETGAAGVVRVLPCLTIRGISHYADSHRSHDWDGYAAAVAGAYAKELLSVTWATS
jgi:nucleoside phosphorylase